MRSLGVVATVGLVAVLLGVPATTPAAVAAGPTEKVLVQNVRLTWAGKKYNGGSRASAVIPGIGTVTAICTRDNTIVQLKANNRGAETQMWMAKYETKNDEPVVAVKTARVYRYATRGDTSGSGTGPTAHEGLNKYGRIENQSSGYIHGVISQRPARNVDAATSYAPPSTSFKLNWYWNGFRKAAKYSTCTVEARFVTNVTDVPSASSAVKSAKTRVVKVRKKKRVIGRWASIVARPSDAFGLNWHGDADAANAETRTATIPGIGDVELTCRTGRNGDAYVALVPVSTNASVYVETVTGEGVIDDHVDTWSLDRDPVTGLVGPIDLPSNGMMRVYFTVAGRKAALIVSSYRKTNDAVHPELNVCEIATAPWID